MVKAMVMRTTEKVAARDEADDGGGGGGDVVEDGGGGDIVEDGGGGGEDVGEGLPEAALTLTVNFCPLEQCDAMVQMK